MNLLSLLRAREPASADIRRELAAISIPAHARAVADIQNRRRQALLDGEIGPALDQIEGELVAAQREHDRAIALKEELTVRLAQAEQREKVDALTARKAAAESESAAVAKAITAKLPALCAELVTLRDRYAASVAECRATDAELILIGSTDRCACVAPILDQKSKYNESVVARLDR